MARSRNIKPSFFKNDELAELPMSNRLLFAGLWTLSDCNGNLEYRPKRIKAELFPYDDLDIEKAINNLSQYRFIRIYSVQGRQYINIPNFVKHQNPHKNEREKGSDIPTPEEEDATAPENKGLEEKPEKIGTSTDKIGTDRADSFNLIPDSLNLIPEEGAQESSCSTPKKSKRKIKLPDDFEITDAMREWFSDQKFTIDLDLATEQWKDSMLAKDFKYVDWVGAWRNGMRNANKWNLQDTKIIKHPRNQKAIHNFDNVDYSRGINADGSF